METSVRIRTTEMLRLLMLFALAATMAGMATAADLVLECEARDATGERHIQRTIEIVEEPRYFSVYKGRSRQGLPDREGFPELIDQRMVVLVDDEMKKERYDRRTGEYLFRDDGGNEELRGHCKEAVT